MNILQKIKILLKVNSEYEHISKMIREGKFMDSKKWWKSKTVWAVVFGACVNIVQTIKPELMGTPVAVVLTTIATAFGIYGRVSADTTIK